MADCDDAPRWERLSRGVLIPAGRWVSTQVHELARPGAVVTSIVVAAFGVVQILRASDVGEASEWESGSAGWVVTLSAPSSSTVSVDWETSEDTGGEHPADENDFVLASGTLTFDPGETEETITVEVVGDGSSEFDETFLVNLLAAVHAELGKSVGVGTIRDLDLDVS